MIKLSFIQTKVMTLHKHCFLCTYFENFVYGSLLFVQLDLYNQWKKHYGVTTKVQMKQMQQTTYFENSPYWL